MAAELLNDITDETPAGDLRSRLEQAIAAQRAAEKGLSVYQTKELLTEKGFDLVKPEDLADVAAAEREAKAGEIQASRKALQEELLRKALGAQGIEGDALEDLVSQAVGVHNAESEAASTVKRMREAGNLPGSPVPAINPEKLHGFEAIEFALAQNESKRTRS